MTQCDYPRCTKEACTLRIQGDNDSYWLCDRHKGTAMEKLHRMKQLYEQKRGFTLKTSMPVEIDTAIPDNEIHVYQDGKLIGKMINIRTE